MAKKIVIKVNNPDFDYDKLAEAIVKAQQKANESVKSTGKFRSALMWLFNIIVYSSVVAIASYCIYIIWTSSYVEQTPPFVGCMVFTFVLAAVAIGAFVCLIESFRDKNSDAREHFNINISLIALLVAIIALIKGVG